MPHNLPGQKSPTKTFLCQRSRGPGSREEKSPPCTAFQLPCFTRSDFISRQHKRQDFITQSSGIYNQIEGRFGVWSILSALSPAAQRWDQSRPRWPPHPFLGTDLISPLGDTSMGELSFLWAYGRYFPPCSRFPLSVQGKETVFCSLKLSSESQG